MTLKAVLFDLDETLFDRTGSLRHFLADQRKRFPALKRIAEQEYIDQFLLRDKRGRVSKSTVYRELLRSLLPDFLDSSSALHRDYESNFWRFAHAYPGMNELFEQLGNARIRTGIVTNGEMHIQLRSLLALDLDRIVNAYVISEAENVRKPDLEIFKLAADRLNVQPEECLFVGDSPISDILGAQNSGMKAIWFPNGAIWPSNITGAPDGEIASLIEVIPLVRQWQ